jgi:hypothetical protein
MILTIPFAQGGRGQAIRIVIQEERLRVIH